MRRAGNLFDKVVERENLRLAFWKASKGQRDTSAARAFGARLDDALEAMASGLRDGTFRWGEAVQFTIFDPKERRITAPCFRERVAHHAIMNVCEPVFERVLIADSFACRKGKGQSAALLRARTFARREPFFLKIDVRKYFESIAHDRLIGRLHRLFKDRRLLDLFERIIRGHGEGRGLPIGSLTSQHFANHYLAGLDRLVKEGLRAPGYVRYMDDVLIWDRSTRFLVGHLGRIERFLEEELGLELKRSPYINRVEHGVDFLGCRVFPDRLTLNRRSRIRFRRKLYGLERDWLAGRIDELTMQQRATSLLAFTRASGVKSWRWRRRVIEQSPVVGPGPRTG